MFGVSNSRKSPGATSSGKQKQAPWNPSTTPLINNTTATSSRKPEAPRKPDVPRNPSSGLRRPSLLDTRKKPSSINTTGAFKPPAAAATPPRGSRLKNPRAPKLVDLQMNKTPPLTSSILRSQQQQQQQSPSASTSTTSEPPPPPETTPPPTRIMCRDPGSHPGSSTRGRDSPANEFFFLERSWLKGPGDPSGTVVALSDRPSLCMSVSGWELAVGSSDHAVYTIDLQTCGVSRIMHGKSYGHTEWVTCVDHLPDGRIISGGMDSKLCLWEKRGVRSRDLRGHSASVSGVKAGCFNSGAVAVSSSYDRSLILWDLGTAAGKEVGRLVAHTAPVTEFASSPQGRLVSGCRDGTVILWDVATRTPVLQCKNAHKGHATAMKSLHDDSAELFLSGGQDGLLQVWDFRCKKPVHFVVLHRYKPVRGSPSPRTQPADAP